MYVASFIKSFIETYPLLAGTNMSFCLLVPLQDVALPHFYGKLIDAISNRREIKFYMLCVLVIFIVLELGFVVSDMHDIRTFSTFQTFIRTEIVKNVMSKFEKNFLLLNVENVMSKLVKLPNVLQVFYERLKYTISPYVLGFSASVIYFFSHDRVLGGTLLVFAITYLAVILSIPFKICKNPSMKCDQSINEIHEEIDDVLRNFIAMHGNQEKQDHELRRLAHHEQLFTVKFSQTMTCLLNTKAFASVLLIIFVATFIYRCKYLIESRSLPTSVFVTLFFIIIYLTNSMINLEGQMRDMIFEWGALVEADEMFEQNNLRGHRRSDPRLNVPSPMNGIYFDNVHLKFPQSNTATLKGVTFRASNGEIVVLTGNVGCGKSTILKLIARFYEPTHGNIYLNGVNFRELTLADIKRRIGYVPQHSQLFNRSVYDNLLYGNEALYTRTEIENIINSIGLAKEFTALEDGIDTKVGKNGQRLSGGQRQLVWCLRVLLQKPDVVVMDEPTASLDKESKEILWKMLKMLMRGKTVIIVTHDEYVKQLATRRIEIENGKVVVQPVQQKKDE